MSDLEKFKNNNNKYLTFYHEVRIPEHYFFQSEKNIDNENNLLIITSPSRMGNHLLLSMLDNHSEIPRIPGEDGFLFWSFVRANYDLNYFLNKLIVKQDVNYLMTLSTDLRYNKWKLFKEYYLNGGIPKEHSGIKTLNVPAKIDFQGLVHDINYNDYKEYIKLEISKLNGDYFFKNYFNIYLNALLRLDYEYSGQKRLYDGIICSSGMRTQVKWVLKNYNKSKIVTSLRDFGSYAVSHVKSRYGLDHISDEHLKEAWEHWYHKVIDAFYLKVKYPEQVCLVAFDDLILKTKETSKSIAEFLNIKHENSMLDATIFGIKVKGNSSVNKDKSTEGKFYSNKKRLNDKDIPYDAFHLWENFDLIKTQ